MSERGPGPELDALVAEKVAGWEWRVSSCSGRRALYAPGRAPEWMQAKADMSELICYDCLDDAGLVGDFPASTDLTTCAAAAEEARKAGKIACWFLSSGYGLNPPEALVQIQDQPRPDEVVGETSAHALALALLKAFGVDPL